MPLDLVLLDLGLPDISGLDVLKIIKTTSPSTGVIIITAYGDVETTVKATQMKGDDFVLKPIDLAALGTILTGMGDDGAEGIRAMKRRGGIILAQNEETCVVYGMPKAAYLSGCVDRMVPLNCVAREIDEFR